MKESLQRFCDFGFYMDRKAVENIESPSNPIAGLVRAGREVFERMPPALFI